MAKKDFYEVLGVGKGATADELKKAYRKAALEHHPDKAKGDADKKAAEAKFKEINEAYDVLKDPQKKAAYDAYGHAAFEPGMGGFGGQSGGSYNNPFGGAGFGGFDFQSSGGFAGEDIFEMFFGRSGSRGRAGRTSTSGRDLHYTASISFDQAVHGGEERIHLSHLVVCKTCQGSGSAKGSQPVACDRCGGSGEIHQTSQSIFGQFTTASVCPKCQGEGTVIADPCRTCNGKGREEETEEITFEIPAGVDNGTEMRFAGKGDAGVRGGRPGDLYVEFRVKPHKYFQRRGNHIYVSLPLSLSQAALGATINVPTIDGEATVKIPAGTTHGTEVRLASKGVKRLQGSGRGDQFLAVSIEVPSKLSGEEKKLLEQLSKVEAEPKKPWE